MAASAARKKAAQVLEPSKIVAIPPCSIKDGRHFAALALFEGVKFFEIFCRFWLDMGSGIWDDFNTVVFT